MAYWDWTPRQQRTWKQVGAVAGLGIVVLFALRFAGIIEPPKIEKRRSSHYDPPSYYTYAPDEPDWFENVR